MMTSSSSFSSKSDKSGVLTRSGGWRAGDDIAAGAAAQAAARAATQRATAAAHTTLRRYTAVERAALYPLCKTKKSVNKARERRGLLHTRCAAPEAVRRACMAPPAASCRSTSTRQTPRLACRA